MWRYWLGQGEKSHCICLGGADRIPIFERKSCSKVGNWAGVAFLTRMELTMNEVVLKRFEQPDEIREFERGKFEIVRLGGLTIGRATYQPGWKWFEHVRPLVGTSFCEVEHVGFVVSGNAVAAMEDGATIDLTPDTLFHIPPTPHDSWVVGDQPYVSLHFLGADHYTK